MTALVRTASSPEHATRKLHIGFVHTHPIQYFAPLYAELNQTNDLAITALYLSDYSIRGAIDGGFGRPVKWDIDLLHGYQARFVEGAEKRDEVTGFFSMIAPGTWREVQGGAFDAIVVHGHTPAAMLLAAAAAKQSGIPVFLRCETHLGLRRSKFKTALRRLLIGRYYRLFDGVLAIGSANRRFHRAMGIPESRIFMMPYAVDNKRFSSASRLTDAERLHQRAELGLGDDRPLILYAAKLQRRKRPDDLLRAAARLNADRIAFHLVLVGSGEMEAELRRLADELGVPNIRFAGFVNQAALPRIYGAADVFVLPSEDEPWGLAVNEAMCAGLPVIASRKIGCVPDLVHDGLNGRTFPAGDVGALTDALREVLVDDSRRRNMGHASRALIENWSYAECAAGLRAALGSIAVRQSTAGAFPRQLPASDRFN